MSKMEEYGTSENLRVQEKKELGNGVKQHVEADQESDTENIESYLGIYVVVSYNGSAYPGFVKEIGYEDITLFHTDHLVLLFSVQPSKV